MQEEIALEHDETYRKMWENTVPVIWNGAFLRGQCGSEMHMIQKRSLLEAKREIGCCKSIATTL